MNWRAQSQIPKNKELNQKTDGFRLGAENAVFSFASLASNLEMDLICQILNFYFPGLIL